MSEESSGITTRVVKLNRICNDIHLCNIIKEHTFNMNECRILGNKVFTTYILHSLNSNNDITINEKTILTSYRSIIDNVQNPRLPKRKKDDNGKFIENEINIDINNRLEYDTITSIVNQYFKKVPSSLNATYNNYTRPLGLDADAYYVNLKNHISLNFFKYQNRYLLNKMLIIFKDKLTRDEIKFILFAIQIRINYNNDYIYSVEKRATRFNKIINKNINEILQFIKIEQLNIKTLIKSDLYIKDKVITNISYTNIIYFLRYFKLILTFFNNNNMKGFPIVPQYDLKMGYIKFDVLSLSTIYNKWKNKKLTIKEFSNNYKNYFNQMFNINIIFKKTLKRFPIVTSINTNGYTTNILFNKQQYENKIKKEKVDNKKEKIEIIKNDLEECYNKNIKDKKELLFDANELKSNSDYLNKYDIIGIDPGNSVMFDISTTSGLHFNIHKKYYYNISHITRNNKKLKTYQDNSNIKIVIDELNTTTYKTHKLEEYIKYINCILDNWKKIFSYYTKNMIYKLKFDSYIHKNKAYARISKEIIKKVKDETQIYKKYKKYFNITVHNENKNKPLLFAFGSGNGDNSITNTKNSKPKGPIKKLMNELSKKQLVISTPEYKTSQLCSNCFKQLDEVYTYHLPKDRACDTKEKKNNKKNIIKFKQEINTLKKQLYNLDKNDFLENKFKKVSKKIDELILLKEVPVSLLEKSVKLFNQLCKEKHLTKTKEKTVLKIKNKIESLEKSVSNNDYYKKSYRLRRCISTCCHSTKRCFLLERNVNASINMITVLKEILIKGDAISFKEKSGQEK